VGREPGSGEGFAAWLVATRHLTDYQAARVVRGQVDDFFFGPYKVLERIGKGRLAGAYRAVDPHGRPAAVWVLPPSKARDPETLACFQREARLAVRLNHHGVVRTLHHGERNGVPFLVTEQVEGQTLEEVLLRRGPLPPLEALRIAFLTALGLQHVYENGMVHRDLKPANLMLCPAPKAHENTLRAMVKILDVGLGRMLRDPVSPEAAEDPADDETVGGTPDYLAPEQAHSPGQGDIRADLYSLGCTLYHALAGQPPFPDDNLVRQLLRHATQAPRPLPGLNRAVTPALDGVVRKLMAKSPDGRYQTPAEAAQALRHLLAAHP
jgi:serine/threonine-protein kinase